MKDKRLPAMFRPIAGAVAGLAALLVLSACKSPTCSGRPVGSAAYRGHEHDADIACFVAAYPAATGTRLDDCVLCHTDGEVPDRRGRPVIVNACDYCHHAKGEGRPFAETLNAFGAAYAARGRSVRALRAIEGEDSDGDGHGNLAEIRAGTFPGRAASNPDKPPAPVAVLTPADLRSLPVHRQLMLLNAHKQRCDEYAVYGGVRISDLLRAKGVDLERIEGVTVFAPDGYAKTYPREQVVREYPPCAVHPGLDDAALGEGRGIVTYPPRDGDAVPGRQFLLFAFERDGAPLSVSILDPVDHRIRGDGPYRTVRPQFEASGPDRGTSLTLGDGRDFDETLDHNAGDGVRGVTVIRVDPMPPEYEEFDARNASWRFLSQGKLVLYGFGIR